MISVPVNHGVTVEGMVGVRGRPATEVRPNAEEWAAVQGRRDPRADQISQFYASQLRVHRNPIAGGVATPNQRKELM